MGGPDSTGRGEGGGPLPGPLLPPPHLMPEANRSAALIRAPLRRGPCGQSERASYRGAPPPCWGRREGAGGGDTASSAPCWEGGGGGRGRAPPAGGEEPGGGLRVTGSDLSGRGAAGTSFYRATGGRARSPR